MKKITKCLLVAAVATMWSGFSVTPMAWASSKRACDDSKEVNRDIVLAFYNEGLVGLKPRPAFERFMAPDFVEHKPDVAHGTREGSAAFLEQLIAELPQARWEVVRTIAEGQLVFLHGRFTPTPEAPAYAIADVFRLKNCKIVEHWDVVAPPPKEQRNPNSRF
jgi:predicted SnoaL-like aldol condensation-catalyzing enzyme